MIDAEQKTVDDIVAWLNAPERQLVGPDGNPVEHSRFIIQEFARAIARKPWRTK